MSKSHEDYLNANEVRSLDSSSLEAGTNYEDIKKDLTEVESDIVISRKMALVNDAIDQIVLLGSTPSCSVLLGLGTVWIHKWL